MCKMTQYGFRYALYFLKHRACWQRIGWRGMCASVTACCSGGYGAVSERQRMRWQKAASYGVKDCFLWCKKQCLKI